MLLFVCVFLSLVGALLMFYGIFETIKYKLMPKKMVLQPLISIKTEVIEIEKVSRFRWIEYGVKVVYEYEFNGVRFSGRDIYLRGEESSNNKDEAENLRKTISKRKNAFVTLNNPSIASLFPLIASSYKKHIYGLSGSGLMLLIISIFFIYFLDGH